MIHGLSLLPFSLALAAAAPRGQITVGVFPSGIYDAHPADSISFYDLMYLSQVGQTLVEQNEIAEVIPGVASSWEISADMKVYRFKIRPGLKFQDGTPMNLEDIVYSLNQAIYSPWNASRYYLDVIAGYEQGKETRRCPGIRALPDGRLEVQLKRPYAPFLRVLTSGAMVIGKRTRDGGPFVGTGPYRLATRGKERYLEAFPDYRGPYPPKIETVRLISDTGVLTGKRKISAAALPDYLVLYDKDEVGDDSLSDYNKIERPGMSVSGFYLNETSPLLASRDGRIRLIGALRRVMSRIPAGAAGTALEDVYPVGMLGHDARRTSFAALVNRAAADRGPLGGDRITVGVFNPVAGGNEAFARLFQAETGVRVSFVQLTHADLHKELSSLSTDVVYLRWRDLFLDPEANLTPFEFLKVFDRSRHRARFEALRREATDNVLNDQRARKYGEIADLIFDEALYLPVFQWNEVQALRKNFAYSDAVYRYSPMLSEVDATDGR